MNKLLIATGLLFGSLTAFGVSKYVQIKSAVNKLDTKIISIKDLSIKSGKAFFNLTLGLENNTGTDIYINGVLFKITRVFIYDTKGKLLGEAGTDLSEIEINNTESLILKDIPVTIAITDGLNLLFSSGFQITKEDIVAKAQIEGLGYTFII